MDNIYLNKLLDDICDNLPRDIVEPAMKELYNIDDELLGMLVMPVNKSCWHNASKVLANIGYPRVQKIIPDLLKWLQDINWPGAYEIAELLSQIGKPIIPYIKEILKSTDFTWQYWILIYIVGKWPTELVFEIKSELENIAYIFDLQEGTDIEAIKLLSTYKIWSQIKVRSISDSKKAICLEYLSKLEVIKEISD